MSLVNPSALAYEGIHLTNADFTAGKDDGATLEAGVIGEVATAEIGEDGQLSAYDAVLLGDKMDPTGNSSKGKQYVELADSADAAVADTVQFRYIVRDKNSNRRVPLTRWFTHRGENNTDPRLRTPVTPRQPFIKDGRIIALEVKDETATAEVTLANSTFEAPARGGY